MVTQKDTQRIQDIRHKALGRIENMKVLARAMARRITNLEKAEARYLASKAEYGEYHEVTNIFKERFKKLNGGLKVVENDLTLENDVTEKNTIYLPTASAVALWDWELVGQFSDGMWENTQPYDHWRAWANVDVKLGNPRVNTNNYRVQKRNYGLSQLKKYVGDRMLAYGKFGKAVGNDILLLLKDGLRTIIEDLPTEPITLNQLKKQIAGTWKKNYVRFDHLTNEHLEKFYSITYTEKELNQDLKNIKAAMQNEVF